MVYTPNEWADNDKSKPLSAARFEHMEDGIVAADAGVTALNTKTTAMDTRLKAVENATGIWQVTLATQQTSTTTITDCGELTQTIAVVAGQKFLVTVDVDLRANAAVNYNTSIYLSVDGTRQAKNIIWNPVASAAGPRSHQSASWLVTGLAAGNRIFKIQMNAAGTGTGVIMAPTHSEMTIQRV